jgi:hypothetical protein
MATESVLSGLEPRACWRHFEALTKIARPSRHEEPVIEHIRGWAAEHGFELRQDAARNLVGRGLTTGQHIRNMFWTAGPALGISLVAFLVLGFLAEPKGGVSTDAALDVLEHEFNITVLNLLPLALLVVFTVRKVPPSWRSWDRRCSRASSPASRSGAW